MSDLQNVKSSEMLVARQASKHSIVFGAVLTVLGIFAVLAPMFTGVAVTVLVGMLLLASGIVEVIFAFQADSFGKGVLRFLFGGLGVLAGMVVIATPVASLGVLTVVLAAFFLASGGIDIVLALKLRPEDGWGWMLFSGILSIALGVLDRPANARVRAVGSRPLCWRPVADAWLGADGARENRSRITDPSSRHADRDAGTPRPSRCPDSSGNASGFWWIIPRCCWPLITSFARKSQPPKSTQRSRN